MSDPSVDTISGTPEHIAEMVAKADAGTNNHGDAGKPLLAGKYKSEEELNRGLIEVLKAKHGGNLEEAYKSLASNISGKDATSGDAGNQSDDSAGGDGQTGDPAVGNTDDGNTDGSPEGSSSGVDVSELVTNASLEWSEKGELSEETYQKLSESFKAPREMIDEYIEGMQAKAELAAVQVYNMVGGKEQFESMKTWAAGNLTNQQIEMFNDDITSGNPAFIARAVDMCNTAYTKANGSQGSNFLNSNVSTNSNSGGYGSLQEFKRDLSDSRYKTGDDAFHAMVQARLKNTSTF